MTRHRTLPLGALAPCNALQNKETCEYPNYLLYSWCQAGNKWVMSEITTEQRRLRGRPQVRSDEETRGLIAAAAREVFVASGYDAANMDDVAKTAAVSKKTLYRLIPTKAELFKASFADRIESFILALDEERLATLPAEAALARAMTEYGILTLSEDSVAIHKLVLAESERFPEIAADFYRDAVVATQRVIVRCLQRQRQAGEIQLDDVDEAAGMLRGMMIFEPSRGAMLGQVSLPSTEDIKKRAARCARLFLNGCQAKQKEA
jgi:AcrR family transcriptional regulator